MPNQTDARRAGILRVLLILSLALLIAGTASAAGYPRRIAVAPFTSLAKEDLGSTVAVLPRLVASRLMALAGADVQLLQAGGKSPEEAAKEAKYPLLLQGTVSKLGKGYSIDVVVVDLAEGKTAGAFFAAAATEDDIIAQLGPMSGEIAEKIFGVQGALRAASPAPVAAAPVVAAPTVSSIGGIPSPSVGVPAAPAAQAPRAVSAAAGAAGASTVAGASTLAGGWVPSSIKKIAQSDKISDELNGVITLRSDADGNGLVAAYGTTNIYIYRIKGKDLLPYTRIRRPLGHHILSIDAFDLDGDGENEILVTDLLDEAVQSVIFKKKGDLYEEVAEGIRYYLAVLPDWKGKPTLIGQYQGVETPFKGRFVTLRWDGKTLVPGETLPHDTGIAPLWGGVLGISSARFGNEWRLIYTDDDAKLRVLDGEGKSMYKSAARHGARQDFFEWGPYIEIEGRRKRFPLRMPARLAPGSGDTPLILTTELTKGLLDLVGGSYDSTRLVLLLWEGGEFLEKAGTKGISQFISGGDFFPRSDFGRNGRIVVSVIEKAGTVFNEQISRLLLYQAE